MPYSAPSRKDRKGHRRQRLRTTPEIPLFIFPTKNGFVLGTCTREAYNTLHESHCPLCIERRRVEALTGVDEPRFLAAVDMIGRTGATDFQIRYDEDKDRPPVLWMAVVGYADGHYETDAALDPATATMRLLERLLDGGQCQHCGKVTGLDLDEHAYPLPDVVCWYQYDPEQQQIVRGCD